MKNNMTKTQSWQVIVLEPVSEWLDTLSDDAVDKIYAAFAMLKQQGSKFLNIQT